MEGTSYFIRIRYISSYTHKMEFKNLCVICLSPMEAGDTLFTTDCEHVFHSSCFKEAKINASGVFTCPLCPPSEMLSSSDDPLFEDYNHTMTGPQYQPANLVIVPEFPIGNVLENNLLTVIRIKAPVMVTKNGIGIDLILVIDVSGSMDGSKFDAVKTTLRFVVSQMHAKNRLCLIKFNDHATKLTPLLQTTETNKHVFLEIIDHLRADGNTDICSGIDCAFDTLLHRHQYNQITSVAVLTDGQDQDRDLREQTQRGLAQLRDVSLYTFGFGVDHNSQLLADVAKQGHGRFCHIKDVDQEGVITSLGNFLEGIVSVYAQNLIIKLTAQNDCTISDVQTTYQAVRENPSGVSIMIPDLFYEENKCILAMIHMPLREPSMLNPECLLTVSVSYEYVVDKTRKTLIDKLEINRVNLNSIPTQEPNHVVDEERNRLITTRALTTASQLGNTGQLHAARGTLKNAKQRIEQSVTAHTEIAIQLIADLNKSINGLQSHKLFSSEDDQSLSQQHTHYTQRATNCDSSNQRPNYSVSDAISDKIVTIQMYIKKTNRLNRGDLIKNLEESLRLHQIWLETLDETTKKRNETQLNIEKV